MTAFVFGNYKRYVPLFCYSVVKSYPEYSVKVFVDGRLGESEWNCIDEIKKNVSPAVHVVEHAFEGLVMPECPKLKGGPKILLRWLFEGSDFSGFDCVYFSDVDFLVLRQQPTLAEFHVANANRFGLPFSNMVREDKTRTGRPPSRLSGCHFVLAEPYFTSVDPVVRAIKDEPGLISDAVAETTTDEHFLYYLVQRAIPFDGEQLRQSLRPIPGPHLGVARNRWNLSESIEYLMRCGPDGNPAFPGFTAQLRAFCEDPVFLRILWRANVPEVAVVLAQAGVLPPGAWQKIKMTSLLAEAGIGQCSRRMKARLGLGAA